MKITTQNPHSSAQRLRAILRQQLPSTNCVVLVHSGRGGVHLRVFLDSVPKGSLALPVIFNGLGVRTFLRK